MPFFNLKIMKKCDISTLLFQVTYSKTCSPSRSQVANKSIKSDVSWVISAVKSTKYSQKSKQTNTKRAGTVKFPSFFYIHLKPKIKR